MHEVWSLLTHKSALLITSQICKFTFWNSQIAFIHAEVCCPTSKHSCIPHILTYLHIILHQIAIIHISPYWKGLLGNAILLNHFWVWIYPKGCVLYMPLSNPKAIRNCQILTALIKRSLCSGQKKGQWAEAKCACQYRAMAYLQTLMFGLHNSALYDKLTGVWSAWLATNQCAFIYCSLIPHNILSGSLEVLCTIPCSVLMLFKTELESLTGESMQVVSRNQQPDQCLGYQ